MKMTNGCDNIPGKVIQTKKSDEQKIKVKIRSQGKIMYMLFNQLYDKHDLMIDITKVNFLH